MMVFSGLPDFVADTSTRSFLDKRFRGAVGRARELPCLPALELKRLAYCRDSRLKASTIPKTSLDRSASVFLNLIDGCEGWV